MAYLQCTKPEHRLITALKPSVPKDADYIFCWQLRHWTSRLLFWMIRYREFQKEKSDVSFCVIANSIGINKGYWCWCNVIWPEISFSQKASRSYRVSWFVKLVSVDCKNCLIQQLVISRSLNAVTVDTQEFWVRRSTSSSSSLPWQPFHMSFNLNLTARHSSDFVSLLLCSYKKPTKTGERASIRYSPWKIGTSAAGLFRALSKYFTDV